jgi:eukaryotic-like serine/threonine-protein kinase
MSTAGAMVGRYAIERELGRGGMATVYLAEDRKLHRRVALKILRPELAATLGPERFLREIGIAARLSHPHILQLHDSGEADGRLFYAMPFVEGESLRQRLAREPQLPVDDVIDIVRAVAAALDHAHKAGIIHRDVKPENILLASGQPAGTHPLVADFGIARALDVAGGERLTETGLALGTPAYMSPEQAAGAGHLDHRSDIYALGCVTYEMLAGAPPFTGPTAQSILARHAVDPIPPLHTVRPRLPRGIEDVIERALAKVPADRFTTAGQFADVLAAAAAGTAAARRIWRSRATVVGGLGAAMLAAAVLAPNLLPGRAGDRVSRIQPAGTSTLRAGSRAAQPILAVLPFQSTSSDTRDAYFAQGMHQEMISQLGMISGMTVIARASVMRYGDSAVSANKIAEDLGADFLLRGRVRKDLSGVGLTAELVDARTGREIWKDAYHRRPTEAGLSAIRGEVVRGIAEALRVKISSVERARLSGRSTENTAAYNLYLRATQLDYGSDPAQAVAAAELLKQAIALDSGFAPAFAQLGEVYSVRSYIQGQSRAWSDSAIVLARRALQLDSSLPAGYHVLALSYLDQGRLAQAAQAYAENVRLNPSDGHALKVLGWIELLRGNLPEAVLLLLDAKAVAPMDQTIYGNLHLIAQVFGDQSWSSELRRTLRALGVKPDQEIGLLLHEGKTREAVSEAERFLGERPSSFRALGAAAKASVAAGDYRRAKEHFDAMYRIAPDDWDWWGLTYRTTYADVLLKTGERRRALELLERTLQDAKRLVERGDERPGIQREIAAIYAAKGDLDQAYAWLTRAINVGWRLEHIHPSQLFSFLHGTPRFHTLIARIEADVQQAKEQVARAGLALR